MKKKKNSISMDPDSMQVSAASEFTGLIPSVSADQGEIEDYEELYPFYPKIPKKK